MDPLAPLKSFDRLQRRHRSLAVPVAVVKKFGDDQAGNLSALIAYYGFFSLFPLILVMVSVLGFILDGNPDAQEAVVDSALKQIPIVGEQIRGGSLEGSGVALVVGIVGALLAGLGVTLAAQTAFNRVHAIPHRERPNFLSSRLRGLGLLALLGTLQVISTAAAGARGRRIRRRAADDGRHRPLAGAQPAPLLRRLSHRSRTSRSPRASSGRGSSAATIALDASCRRSAAPTSVASSGTRETPTAPSPP